MKKKKIGELAVAEKWITTKERDRLLEQQKKLRLLENKSEEATLFGKLLQQEGFVNEKVVVDLLERQNVTFISKETMGDYEIFEELGQGGMGKVYKAKHKKLQKFFALKILHPHLCQHREFRERFTREIATAMEFPHQHAIQIRDFGELENGLPYFAMDLSQGTSLANILAREKIIPEKRALDIIRQVLSALEVAHSKKIVHRDLKPSNILIENRNNKDHALVLDFGIAKSVISLDTKNITEQGFLGTPSYMSPEQVQGDIDTRSDLFSVGIILYELVTGKLPFQGNTLEQILYARVIQEAIPVTIANPKISSKIAKIITKSLKRKPQKRFACARDFIKAIDACKSSSHLHFSTFYGLFLVVITVFALLVWAFAKSNLPPEKARQKMGEKKANELKNTQKQEMKNIVKQLHALHQTVELSPTFIHNHLSYKDKLQIIHKDIMRLYQIIGLSPLKKPSKNQLLIWIKENIAKLQKIIGTKQK